MHLSYSGLSSEIIASMQDAKTEIEAIRILEALLSRHLSDTGSPGVDECFAFLSDLLEIAEYLILSERLSNNLWLEYTTELLQKAVNDVIGDDLQNCIDINERHYDSYDLDDNFLNASEANIAYANARVAGLIKDYLLDNPTQMIVNLYRSVATPTYTMLNKIVIKESFGDDLVFDTIESVQNHINSLLFYEMIDNGSSHLYLHAYLVLGESSGYFEEIKLDLKNMDGDYLDNSFMDCVFDYLYDMSDYDFYDLLIGCQSDRCKIKIDKTYFDKKYETLDLSFLYRDIVNDYYLLMEQYRSFSEICEQVNKKDAANLGLEILQKTYQSDINMLNFELILSKIENRESVDTSHLQIDLLEFKAKEEYLITIYLSLKALVVKEYHANILSIITEDDKKFHFGTGFHSIGVMQDYMEQHDRA